MRAERKSSPRADKKTPSRAHKRGTVGYSKKSALLEEAITQMNAGKYGRSSAALKELLALDPLNTEARRLFATLHLRLGSLMAARSAFESLAKEALQRQDYWLAESLLREYLAAGPRCVPFLEMLAHVHEEKGDPMAAVAEYAKAVDILIEDVDPDHPNRPAELYAKIRELAPASSDAIRLAAMFDTATGKILRPPALEAPTESALPPASQSVEGDGTPGETSEQLMSWEKVEDSTAFYAVVDSQESTRLVTEVPAPEVEDQSTANDPVAVGAESRQQAVAGESNAFWDAGPHTTEFPSVSVDHAFQLTGSADEVTPPPRLAVQASPAPNPAVVNEPRSEGTSKFVKVGKDVVDSMESRAAEAGVEERLSESSRVPVSEAEPPTAVPESESGPRLASKPSVAQSPISAPMPWEQVEEVAVQIPQSEPQPALALTAEPETPPLPEGVSTEATSTSVTQLVTTSAAASDQIIERQMGLTPEAADTVTAPPKAEEPRLSMPAESRLSAFSWEEILGHLGLSSRKYNPPATPQAESVQHHESALPSPASILDEGVPRPTRETLISRDASASMADEPPTPLVATPSPDFEAANGGDSASSALSTPMPWEQVEEVSVSIPRPEPEPIEVHPAEPEEAVVSNSESLDTPLLAENVALYATATEAIAPEVQKAPVELVQTELIVEANPVQPEPESRPAVATDQPSGTQPSREVSSTGSEPMASIESDGVREAVPEQQGPLASLAPESSSSLILPEPTAEELRPTPPQDEVAPETEETVTASFMPPQDVVEMVESPAVSGPAPTHLDPQEERISQVSEEPVTLELHLQPPPIHLQPPTPESVVVSSAPGMATMTSAVDVLFERTRKQAPVSTHDTTTTPNLKKRRMLPFARARIGLVLFVRNCVSTTRSIIVTLLGLIGLGVAAAIVSVGATGLLWVAMEERPNNAFHNLTTTPQRNISDPRKNGYLLLLGIDAAPSRDPLQVGYERKFEETDRDTLRVCLTGSGGRASAGSASAQVLSGWLRAVDPASQFSNHAAGVKTWLTQSDLTLGRYRQWLKMPFEDWGYGQPVVPNCQQIVAVHRLYLAEGFAQDLDSGVDRLESDLTAWRTALAQARTLAVKMMAAEAVNDDEAVTSGLLTRPDLDPKHVPRLLKLMRPLDQVEQSVRWPMHSQFVLATKTLDGDLKRDKLDERPWYVSVVAAMPLPKQRRFNAYAEYYEAANKTSAGARPAAKPKLSMYIKTPATSWLDHLLNPIEHVVGVEPLPRWEDYSGRILETDARLRLASLQAWVRKGPLEGELATRLAKAGQNFYDPFTGLPMLINSEKGLIYSVGHDGKDQEGDPKLDVAVSVPPFPTAADTDTKHNIPVKTK